MAHVNGAQLRLATWLEPRPDRWVKLRRALRRAATLDRTHRSSLEASLGHTVAVELLRRPFLAIFHRL